MESGFFTGIHSFAELEAKIAALPDEQQRGDAFEVFAEAYLTTQRVQQASSVWPDDSVPLWVLERLNLPIRDMGVDGVLERATAELVPYQVKFRTGRPSLTWTELSKFYGLADAGCPRLLITNCDDIAETAQSRKGAVFVRGNDLEGLTRDDFENVAIWLAGLPPRPSRTEPQPFQRKAVADIIRVLRTGNRATALMACATGKTFVGLWVAETLKAHSVLVLVPSLALVRQTLERWLREIAVPCEYVCVCSDQTVAEGADELVVKPSDLYFNVTTTPKELRGFLRRQTNAVKLVFSTYQSSAVVAEAAAGLPPFAFGVFDEAHRTAGRVGMNFALALDDQRLPIKKRLFLTATPRHYNVDAKDKFGDAKLVFSMDATETYGPVAHRLPFSAAAKLGVITDYKVVISEVTSEMVTNELLRRGIVNVAGHAIKARQVANQIALSAAIKRFGVSKIFTFHSSVRAAESFTDSGPEGLVTHLSDFSTLHINGEMTTAYRGRLMREFKAARRAVISNARCLTEGVDVPAVDMVAFMSPRRSVVDIVQATGRAMRLSPETGKQFGYVLVPLFVEQQRGEPVEEAVRRSNFDDVWEVLRRLREHDDLLAQEIDRMRIERGKTGGFDDSRFREKVIMLGPELSLEDMRRFITAACIDAVGDSWFGRFGQLSAYKDRFGDCDVPARWPEDKRLATWVINQRVLRREGSLNSDKVDLLDTVGFNWQPKSHQWRGNYLALLEFRAKHGHCRVPQEWKENPVLAKWVATQRVRRKRGQLFDDRIAMLEKIGFDWSIDLGTFDSHMEELAAFKERFGHTRVPVKWKENRTLATWVVDQRHRRRKGQLRDGLIDRLDELGFEWEVSLGRSAAWEANFQRLLAFKAEHGHFRVGSEDLKARALLRWLQTQRLRFHRGKLHATYQQRLNEVDFPWKDPRNIPSNWEAMFARLGEFRQRSGGFRFSAQDSSSKQLSRWAQTQRKFRRLGKLSEERIRKLNDIEFPWKPRTRRERSVIMADEARKAAQANHWEEMFSALTEFFKIHGHCNVPLDWPANPQLGQWVARQRLWRCHTRLTEEQKERLSDIGFAWTRRATSWHLMFSQLAEWIEARRRNGDAKEIEPSAELRRWMLTQRQRQRSRRLTPDREQRLNGIGFDWQPNVTQWDQTFELLTAFQATNGHCRVPHHWEGDPQLGGWVSFQRQRYRAGKLTPDQIRKLEALGFEWRISTVWLNQWGEGLNALKAFKAEHGHTRVPVRWKGNLRLASWVATQRKDKKRGRLPAEREAALASIGFEWHTPRAGGLPREGFWNAMFEKLQQYKATHGHCLVPQRYKDDRQLASWVSEQRIRRNKSELGPDEELRLTDIGFNWNPIGNKWDEMFAALVAFKDEHGHVNVPQKSRKYTKLAAWVAKQRYDKKKNKPISPPRVKRLNELGFAWAFRDPFSWEQMFSLLEDFKKVHGHCNIPQNWRENKQLGKWVNTQRTHFKRGKLRADRLRQLEGVGFIWDLRPNYQRPAREIPRVTL